MNIRRLIFSDLMPRTIKIEGYICHLSSALTFENKALVSNTLFHEAFKHLRVWHIKLDVKYRRVVVTDLFFARYLEYDRVSLCVE